MWFRLYTELLNDPKAQRLPGEQFKGWINILCLAKENGGLIPPIEDIAFKLRMSDADANCLVEELAKRGLLDADGETIKPHNWDKRQYKSDVSSERVKRFRNGERNVTETVDETPPEQIQSRAEPEPEVEATNGAGAHTAKPKPPKVKPEPDARTQHVAIQLCREIAKSYPPKELWDKVIEILGDTPDAALLSKCRAEWVERGYNRASWKWLSEWYVTGVPARTVAAPQKRTSTVGKSQPSPASIAASVGHYSMDDFIDDCIAVNDLIHLGHEYDNILERGGAKLEWEIRCCAYYELHKNEPATAEQMAELNARIAALIPKGER